MMPKASTQRQARGQAWRDATQVGWKGRGKDAARGSGEGRGQGKAGPSDGPARGAEEPAEPAVKGGKRARRR